MLSLVVIDEYRKAFGECEAIEVITDVMKAYINNAGVCEAGCGALNSITLNGTSHTHTE